MNNEKLKVYSISVMAMLPINDALELSVITEAEAFDINTYIEHTAALIPAKSMEAAADQAKAFALDKWKPDAGWYSHQAVVLPVTKQFFILAFDALDSGVIDELTDEEARCFIF